jgi:hypothetical protein
MHGAYQPGGFFKPLTPDLPKQAGIFLIPGSRLGANVDNGNEEKYR